jgi:AcrR family transcriptional regulator
LVPVAATRKPHATLRDAHKQLTLQKLLEGARLVFEAHGYSNATIDEIVETAGVSHGTFYLYFPNKREILGQILEKDHIEATLQLAWEMPDEPSLPALRTWIQRYLDLFEKNWLVVRAWIQAGSLEAEAGAAETRMMAGIIDSLAEHVLRYREHAGDPVAKESAHTRAWLMFMLLKELAYYCYLREHRTDAALGVELVANQWHTAIFSADPAPVDGPRQ